LLVGSVSGIIAITDDMIQATPDVASGGAAPTFVRGVLLIDGRMVSLLSLGRVLPEHELEEAA
ncbi:MAG: chemotaxis protein CheW, partial [Phenylobacterium sp.]